MFSKYSNNFILLRRAAEVIGKQYESMPYGEFCDDAAAERSGSFEFEGNTVGYSAYSFNVKKNGDVCFCIDIHSTLPTFLGIKPSYQFVKHQDGSVSYD